jgi:hypothetical protein
LCAAATKELISSILKIPTFGGLCLNRVLKYKEHSLERLSIMEKRMSVREDFTNPFEFELSASEPGASSGGTCRAQGIDISANGLGLLTDYPLVPGMVLRLVLPTRGVETMIPVFAEVAWAGPAGNSGDQVRAGLRFLM